MTYQLIHGSAHHLPEIADKSIHSLICSPPYLGLRKYSGDQGVDWPAVDYSPMAGLPPVHVDAMRCDLGLEPDPIAYIGHLILCLREWHRILRDDSCAWVNLGDSYVGSANSGGRESQNTNGTPYRIEGLPPKKIDGLRPKNLMMIPARFALAAQADGWYLRSAIVWAKGVSFIPHYAGSCMPESVQDRPTQSYEMVYMLAKQEKYYFDMESVKEQALQPMGVAEFTAQHKQIALRNGNGLNQSKLGTNQGNATRNLRSVWAINPSGYKEAHFATWPEALVTPMIKASTSAHGVCAQSQCGAPWRRVVERTITGRGKTTSKLEDGIHERSSAKSLAQKRQEYRAMGLESPPAPVTTGWEPTCNCNCDEVAPAVVCDPFVGSGTSIRAAMKLGRNAIGVDISDEYLGDLVPERASNIQMELAL